MSRAPITPGLTGLLAAAAGVTVANIYYNQPLLARLGEDFGVSASGAGSLSVATQLGYAGGLFFLVPLGDRMERKRLILLTASLAAAFLAASACAPSLGFLVASGFGLGFVCVTPQVIVPYAAHLADPARRGRVIGAVMGGLITGILASRCVGGWLEAWLGWRAVFAGGAVLTLATAAVLRARLPAQPPGEPASYGRLLGSLWAIWRREPVLRRHAWIGACGFAAFCAFWSTLPFYLHARPEHFGPETVGWFGLVAVAGALAAPVSGRLSDRFSARAVNGGALLLMALSFAAMLAADRSLAALAAAVFLMDAGTQASQISNQTRIYGLEPRLRSRVTALYMAAYFLGAAAGSALGLAAWTRWHWAGVCGTGALLSLAAAVPLFLPAPRKG